MTPKRKAALRKAQRESALKRKHGAKYKGHKARATNKARKKTWQKRGRKLGVAAVSYGAGLAASKYLAPVAARYVINRHFNSHTSVNGHGVSAEAGTGSRSKPTVGLGMAGKYWSTNPSTYNLRRRRARR